MLLNMSSFRKNANFFTDMQPFVYKSVALSMKAIICSNLESQIVASCVSYDKFIQCLI